MPLYLLCLALRALNAGWFVVDDTDGFGREGVPLVLLRQLWVNFGIFGEEERDGFGREGVPMVLLSKSWPETQVRCSYLQPRSSCRAAEIGSGELHFMNWLLGIWSFFWGETVTTLQKLGILKLCTPGDGLVDHAQLGQVHPAGADLPPASPLLKPSLTSRRRSQVLILKINNDYYSLHHSLSFLLSLFIGSSWKGSERIESTRMWNKALVQKERLKRNSRLMKLFIIIIHYQLSLSIIFPRRRPQPPGRTAALVGSTHACSLPAGNDYLVIAAAGND